jgi:hypothetical protein
MMCDLSRAERQHRAVTAETTTGTLISKRRLQQGGHRQAAGPARQVRPLPAHRPCRHAAV